MKNIETRLSEMRRVDRILSWLNMMEGRKEGIFQSSNLHTRQDDDSTRERCTLRFPTIVSDEGTFFRTRARRLILDFYFKDDGFPSSAQDPDIRFLYLC